MWGGQNIIDEMTDPWLKKIELINELPGIRKLVYDCAKILESGQVERIEKGRSY